MSALKLKAQTCLDPTAFSFRWPRADALYEPSMVVAKESDDHGDSIRLVLFPALYRRVFNATDKASGQHDWKEKSIGLAVVCR